MNQTYTSKNLLTRQEAADRLRVSLTTMSALIKSGKIYVLRFERQVRIPEEALDAFVRGDGPDPDVDALAKPSMDTYPPTPSILAGAGNEEA